MPDNALEQHNLLKFKIEFHISLNINMLKIGESHQDVIHAGEVKFFKYQVFLDKDNDDDSTTISIFRKASNLNQSSVLVFCSIDQDLQRPDRLSNTFQTLNEQPILIQRQDVVKYCPFLITQQQQGAPTPNANVQKQCFIYISVVGTEQTYYTLSSKYAEKSVTLAEGGAQDFVVPVQGKYSHFVVYLPSNESVTVYLRSYAAKL